MSSGREQTQRRSAPHVITTENILISVVEGREQGGRGQEERIGRERNS